MTTAAAVAHSQLADFIELTKPRVVLMVLLTTIVGFYLGAVGPLDVGLLCGTVLGTALAAAGTLALNQFLERDLDARMDRTRRRPLPEGRVDPTTALGFGHEFLREVDELVKLAALAGVGISFVRRLELVELSGRELHVLAVQAGQEVNQRRGVARQIRIIVG